MFGADVYVKEPLEKVMEDWDFLSEQVIPKFFTFRPYGNNIYGIRTVGHETARDVGSGSALELVKTRSNFEIGPKGKIQVSREPLCAHVTVSGTPHHTEHLFGYWHVNDKDEVIIPLPPVHTEDPGFLLVIMGYPKGDETDRVACYCEKCSTLLFIRELVTGTSGFSKFWRFEREVIREYNSDVKNRTCPECGHLNPYGYTAIYTQDTPEERQARMQW